MSSVAGPGSASFAGLAAVLLCLSATPARAQSCDPVAVRACDAWFSADSLRRALGTEGVRCDVAVRCVDGRLRIDDDGPSWELSQIPQAVRARVVALLIAETLRDPGAPSDPPARPPAGDSSEGSTSASGSEPPPEPPPPEPPEPPPPEPPPEPPPAPSSLLSRPASTEPPTSPATRPSGGRADPGGVSTVGRRIHPGAAHIIREVTQELDPAARVGVGAEVRVFMAPLTAVAGPALVFAYDAVRVEAAWSFGQANDERLGATALMLGHIDLGVSVLCAQWVDASLCVSAFGELGYARVDATPLGDALAIPAEAPFVGGMLEVGVYGATELLAVTVALRGGFGYGLVAEADLVEIAALGGAWIGAHLALELEPGR